ncbi:sensor histidine kinase [Sedimentibacter sp. MB31-C6]|uniref:sensor histidine kinase n=1 Tax=Sedimentibacter sp. MB31-C6 TaxID=3109366 RepID=UPI002DDD633F|nr:GHKL domain-containing protein [Sedimentibacter sp. MB36-C1]WSI04151.1 GHKL domain-containing protein [Sedimentibacter sp. MB36-C1]
MIEYIYNITVLSTYIFEALVAHILYSSAFKQNINNYKYYTLLFGSYFVLSIIHSFNNTLLNLSLFVVINIILALILYDGKFNTKIYYTIFFTVVMLVTEVISLFVLKIYFKNDLILSMASKIILAVISKTLLFILIKTFCNTLNNNSNKIPTNKFLALILISATLVMVLYVLIAITINIKIKTTELITALICAIGLMFSSMIIFFLFEESIREQTDLKEFALLKQKSELEHKHYNILKENYDNIKIIEHDMKKHLLLLNEYAKHGRNKEIINYTSSIIDDIKYSTFKQISYNKALDVILYEKIQSAKNNKIAISINSQNVKFDFIEDIDICIIFSNILDNAIESCEKSLNKEIQLNIFMVNNKIITIEMENSCDVKPIIINEELVTNKSNKENHGFGMKSVKKTIKKYNGQVIYLYNDLEKKFITNISISNNI